MSEYQYYDFRAIDRPLDRAATDALRAISSRAEITTHGLTNEYHWGDFKGNPDRLMEQYFDAHLYVANWGTHRLMLRLPLKLLPLTAVEPYTTEDGLRAWATKTHVVIDFRSDSEDDHEWTEGEGRIDPLLPVRDELRAGDLRALYIGWLATRTGGEEIDEDALEPPVPSGLRKLTEAQRDLATYLRVDDDLFEVAAERSAATAPTGPGPAELAAWVAKLPERQKNDALVQLLAGEGTAAATDLLGRFRTDTARANPQPRDSSAPRRTVKELLAARDELAEKNRRAAAEKKAKDAARRAREAAEARTRHLDSLTGKEADLWREIETAIGAKLPKQYDHAIELLKDLRDLASRAGTGTEFARRVGELREKHSSKPAFKKRLDAAGMPE